VSREPIQGHHQPVLPPNTKRNSIHLHSLLQTNEGQDHLQLRCETNNNQPRKVELFVANLIAACLVFIVYIVIILILSPNFTNTSTIKGTNFAPDNLGVLFLLMNLCFTWGHHGDFKFTPYRFEKARGMPSVKLLRGWWLVVQ
jgi:hypothetical protein